MNMKMIARKVLSFTCALSMLLSPIGELGMFAQAAGIDSAEALTDAIGNASPGDIITLGGDVSIDSVTTDKALTIDLGGYTLTANSVTSNGGTLTIKNGSLFTASEVTLHAYGGNVIVLGSSLNVTGNNLTVADGASASVSGATVTSSLALGGGAHLTVNGGTLSGPVTMNGNANLTVNGGTLGGAVTINGSAKLNVSGGAVNGTVTVSGGGSELNVSGGTVSGAVTMDSYASLAVSDGSVTGEVSATNANVTVSGGTVSGNVSVAVDGGGAKLIVSGGTLSGDVSSENANVNISGGEFAGDVSVNGGAVSITGGSYANPPDDSLLTNVTLVYITAASATKPYDGTPLTTDVFKVEGSFGTDDSISAVTVTGSQTDVGTSYNVPSAAVLVKNSDTHYVIIYQPGTLTVTKGIPVVTAPTPIVLMENGTAQPLVTAGATTGGTLQYSLDNVSYSETIPMETSAGTYTVYYRVVGDANYDDVEPQSVGVTIQPSGSLLPLTITANSAEREYNGEALTDFGYTVTGLSEGDSIQSIVMSGSQTNAGTGSNVPSGAVIVDENDQIVTGKYFITYQPGTLTVTPVPVTLIAASGTVKFNEEVTLGYQCSVDGLVFEGVSTVASKETGSVGDYGLHTVELSGVTLGVTRDTTGNYVVTAIEDGLILVAGEDPVLSKRLVRVEGNQAYYEIDFNPDALVLNDGNRFTIKDTFNYTDTSVVPNKTENTQSINYASVEAECSSGESVTWDYSGSTGTFSVPDGAHVTIRYYTRVLGSTGETVHIYNRAELGLGYPFQCITAKQTERNVKIEPDIYGTNGVYTIGLYVYAENHMETGLGGATFRLLDANKRPMTYPAGEHAGEDITFTTSDGIGDGAERRGYVTITLNEATDGVALHKNTAYYLEMVAAPYTLDAGGYTYYQLDNTYYSFLITDNPNYTYGGIYSYFNGDVMKVRCYSDQKGVSVTMRFSGNYDLTKEQMNQITFTLQREDYLSGGWVDVESHTYAEFEYGRLTFDILTSELEDATDYRLVETNGLPPELADSIELNTSMSVSYQYSGQPVVMEGDEFFVVPEDKDQVYGFVVTNEYVDHKLTIVKVDELTGNMIENTEFTTYDAVSGTAVKTYLTSENGKLAIGKGDSEDYQFDTLYYAMETHEADGFILPKEPQKIYFYFSNLDTAVPDGLPAGETATDLTVSYNTVPVLNQSSQTDVPVVVTWGLKGTDEWPSGVKKIIIGLYQSKNGASPTKVTDGEVPMTLELTKASYYDVTSFKNLPALDPHSKEPITYSVKEETIYDGDDNDVTIDYAQTFSVSGTGWYVVNNQESVRLTVQKKWYQNDGSTPVDDLGEKEAVLFDLYRTTTEHVGVFTREDLIGFLGTAEPVRTNLSLNNANSWTLTVESLEKTDNDENEWYYYALEHVPDNQIDTYEIVAATASEHRSLTIKNQQTPSTITIAAVDLEKEYGSDDPAFVLSASVMEEGSEVTLSGYNTSDETYTAKVTRSDNSEVSFKFKVARSAGEDVGNYPITLTMAEAVPDGYRVVFVPGALTIVPAEVTIEAEGTKVYGDPDPASLVTITGLPDGVESSVLTFSASREAEEDVGTYPITLTGEADQGNFHVTFIPGSFTVTPAPVTVAAEDAEKWYGEEDPMLTATVTGMKHDDSPLIIEYDLTRESGEDVGTYTITPAGEVDQGNYVVSFEPATLTIKSAALTIKVEEAEKIYGEDDPDWEVTIEGLSEEDDGGTLTASGNSPRSYSYCRPGSDEPILSFTIGRDPGENVGQYTIIPAGDAVQGNYQVTYSAETKLTITYAELYIIPKDTVKAKLDPAVSDPVLTATIEGWANGDGELSEAAHSTSEGVVTWTYTRDDVTILTFTLQRQPGEEEGVYEITASAETPQGNYHVYSGEPGNFSILSMLNVEVSQVATDMVTPEAKPAYTYRAEVDLSGTGISGSYNDNGFVDSVLEFTLNGDVETRTLKVPAGASLTVTQTSTNASYSTSITLDGDPYSDGQSCLIDAVDDFYAIRFIHDRIVLPVHAVTAPEGSEIGDTISGSSGYIPLPTEDKYLIDGDFVEGYQERLGYVLPTEKYYVYHHAALYDANGDQIASNISEIKYDSEEAVWMYLTSDYAEYRVAPADAQVRLVYQPKYICQIGSQRFYTLNDAVASVAEGASATIEMLLAEYPMPVSDAVRIPAGRDITLTSASELDGGAVISRSAALTGEELFVNEGTLTLDQITLDGKNIATAKTLVSNVEGATLTVGAKAVLRGANGQNGGALSVSGGEAEIYGTVSSNSATNGGAVYVTAGTVRIISDGVTGNNANHGGAVYMTGGTLSVEGTVSGNSATNGGAIYVAGGTLNIEATVSGNNATSGGAVFMIGGDADVSGTVSGNDATNGGAVYLEGGTFVVSGGTISGNTATMSGGAIYGTNGSVSITGGSVTNNRASGGNGGAIWYGGGSSVSVVGGSFAGNAAVGSGGVIYQNAGTVTLSGGTMGGSDGANTAINGSAVFVQEGSATFSGVSITQNTATSGGAVGIGSTTARLHFSGDTKVSDNKTQDEVTKNVYLDQDSDLIINSAGLGNGAYIGIYISDALQSTRGDACTKFGTYTVSTNAQLFKNDRSTVLDAYYDNYKLIWSRFIQYQVRYINSMDDLFNANFAPTLTKTGIRKYPTNSDTPLKYYPVSQNNPIYDLVTKLYTNQFASSVSDYVYAYTYVYQEKAAGPSFDKFLTEIKWNSTAQKWDFMQNGFGAYGDVNAKTIIIYYADAEYLSITNNSAHTLTVDSLTVSEQNILAKNYGYPTVVNYLTQNTLIPLAGLVDNPNTDDVEPYFSDGKLVLPPSGYVKLLLPGAVKKGWSMNGVFEAPSDTKFHYTLDSLNTPSSSGDYKVEMKSPLITVEGTKHSFTLNGSMLEKGKTYDVLFEERTPICKIVDNNPDGVENVKQNTNTGLWEHAFATLKEAWAYIEANSATTKERTIEMLMDYQQPGTDVLNISAGYDITLTTAEPKGTEGVPFTYVGANAGRATISRDNTNDGAAVIAEAYLSEARFKEACDSALTIRNLIFDGKALAKAGNGGAISTCNNDVLIENCAFKGYTAYRGGAVFIRWGGAEIRQSSFSNCTTGADADKTGGGAIWSTAKILTITDCRFEDCSCTSGKSQGGAIFHNIRPDNQSVWPNETNATFPSGHMAASQTIIERCTFEHCYVKTAAAGAVESDALDVRLIDSTFNNCYSENRNGGALNVYAGDTENGAEGSSVTITRCGFVDCWNPTNGGAIRCTAKSLKVEGSSFSGCHGATGGAIAMTGKSQTKLEIYGTSFSECYASAIGGVVSTNAPTLVVGEYEYNSVTTQTSLTDCNAPSYGGIYQNTSAGTSTATVNNASFENCVSTGSASGALHTGAKTLSITDTTFTGCSASGNGGAMYHTGTTETLTRCVFENCTSGGSGGGAYLNAARTVSDTSCSGCTAVNNGGGLYIKPTSSSSTMTGCTFSGNKLSATESMGGSLYIETNNLGMSDCSFSDSIAAYGGGVYHNGGTLTFTSGTISGCKASISGGGLYSKNTCNLGNTTGDNVAVSGCYAVASGGGIYHTSSSTALTLHNTDVSGCYARQGGGIYSAGNMSVSAGSLAGCHAKNVTLQNDGTVATAAGYSTGNLGGGIYKASGKLTISGGTVGGENSSDANTAAYGGGIYYGSTGDATMSAGSISGNTAAHDGAGIYHEAGKFTVSGGVISKNQATDNGGGIYKAGGTLTVSGGTIGGDDDDDANTAANGAGIFAADGQTVTVSGGSITHNSATVLGGGIAVGGISAKLIFSGGPTVKDNKLNGVICNVELNYDSNEIINAAGLSGVAYIGVYCSEPQDAAHGMGGMPFGTYSKTDNLSRFINDRRPYYNGLKGSTGTLVVWSSFICKITDGEGNLLYKDANGTPAAYATLENSGGNSGAFGTLANGTTGLYRKDGNNYVSYTGTAYQVQMLVQSYTVTSQITLNKTRSITLTTASAEEDECGLFYNGDQKHPRALIIRGGNYNSMFLMKDGIPTFTMESIIIDGGSESGYVSGSNGGILLIQLGSATVGTDATLQNSNAGGYNGGGIRVENNDNNSITLDGGLITNCTSTAYGGGISIKKGKFIMESGSITGCSGKYGGGVRVDAKMYMNGGTITGNSATSVGGGISPGVIGAQIFFSGTPIVTGNTLNGVACNMELGFNSNGIIRTGEPGLKNGAEIGVYVPDRDYDNKNDVFSKHGNEGDPFGTRFNDDAQFNNPEYPDYDDALYSFVNDRNDILRGSRSGSADNYNIYWARNYVLTIGTEIVSDLTTDSNAEFNYTVYVPDAANRKIGGLQFTDGKRTLKLKAGQSTTLYFPDRDMNMSDYTVTVIGVTSNSFGAELADFDSTILQNGETTNEQTIIGKSVSGSLGENISLSPPSGRSNVVFTYTRHTSSLTVEKTVRGIEGGTNPEFLFILRLGDTGIDKEYDAVDQAEVSRKLKFNKGVATFHLHDGESLRVDGLPTDLTYTVSEDLSAIPDAARIRTRVKKNDGSEITQSSQSGTIGEASTMDGVKEVFASVVTFINSYLEIVCKITNRNRALLYYSESDGKLVPAIFETLADAFERVNSGGLKTSVGGSVFGQLRIEMVVPDYTMNEPAVLDSGKTVILSTARTTDKDPYPYTGLDGKASVVTRGASNNESMIEDNGALTLDNIVLDGGYDFGRKAVENGGIIRTGSNVTLTVSDHATLQNSKTSQNGGAIWLGSGSTLSMNGTIEQCLAASGGGVYADDGFAKIELHGNITGCRADGDEGGNGGAVCTLSGNSVLVSADSKLKGNRAQANGGAICTDANLTLRGTIGGTESEESNTAENGGGLYVGEHATLTMYSTAIITGNEATNGGGLYAENIAKLAGGSISNNEASLGGAIYVNGSVTMSGGSVTGNTASAQGGAVYVANEKVFTMTGGAINGGNKSPEGAVTVGGIDSVLNFSGNVKIQDNTDLDDPEIAKNVYLGYDSNRIIRTSGLGSSAYIGVYVADGDAYSLLYEHGIADRNFGSYTGNNLSGARLNKFQNDRDQELKGIAGDKQVGYGSDYFVMWPGKNLYIKVLQKDDSVAIKGARFNLTNIKTDEEVWSGVSGSDGVLTVPWSKIEAIGNNTAIFARNSAYLLHQSTTNLASVLPGGDWVVHILEGNIVTWTKVNPGQTASLEDNTVILTPAEPEPTEVNRTLDVELTAGQESALGSTFILYNDRCPRILFDARGGTLYGGTRKDRVDTVLFGTNKSVTVTINEKDPFWNTIFLNWNTEPDGSGTDYVKGNTHKFYRHTDNDDLTLYAQWVPVVCKITDEAGKLLYVNGAPAIYATLADGYDSFLTSTFTYSGGTGRPTAFYVKMLVDSHELDRPIVLTRGTGTIRLSQGFLTTATTDNKKEDGFPFYSGSGKTVCTIYRGFDDDTSMFTVRNFNFGLRKITLDGGAGEDELVKKTVSVNGGLINMEGVNYRLLIEEGATLCNSETTGSGAAIYVSSRANMNMSGGTICDNTVSDTGNGAAVYVSSGATLNMSGGTICDNTVSGTGNGPGVYLPEGATFNISGNPTFAANIRDEALVGKTNGGDEYPKARQDIFIAGYEAEDDVTNAASLVVTGNLTSGDGSIWVWAEESPHYKSLQQFAKYTSGITNTESSLKVFRNAQDDSLTNASGEPLFGVVRNDDTEGFNVFWGGIEGSARVMLVKVQQTGSVYRAMPGPKFWICKSQDIDSVATGIVGGTTEPTELKGLESGAGGAFFIGELDYDTYYVYETKDGHEVGWFKITVGEIKDGGGNVIGEGVVELEDNTKTVKFVNLIP